jgi:hypothetical protein
MGLRATLLDIAAIATTTLASPGCSSQAASAPSATDVASEDTMHAIDAASRDGVPDDATDAADGAALGDGASDGATQSVDSAPLLDSGHQDAALATGAEWSEAGPTCTPASGNVASDLACALIAQDMPFCLGAMDECRVRNGVRELLRRDLPREQHVPYVLAVRGGAGLRRCLQRRPAGRGHG